MWVYKFRLHFTLSIFQVLFSCCVSSVILNSKASASAWTQEKHRLLVISRADYFTSDLGEISVDGMFVPGRFERIETNTYVEFGLTDRIMIGGKVYYGTSWLTRGNDVEVASGF